MKIEVICRPEINDMVSYPDPSDGQALVNLTRKCGHRQTFCLDLQTGESIYHIQHSLCWDCLNDRLDQQTDMLEMTQFVPSDIQT